MTRSDQLRGRLHVAWDPIVALTFFCGGGRKGGGHAEGQRLDIGKQAQAHRLPSRYATSALN